MSLTPIFKSADPSFNARAAQAAYDLVMKMDDESARVFTEWVVAETVEEIIEKNLDTVQRHLNKVVAKRTDAVKKSLVAKAAADPEGALPYAQALALIEKAKNPYEYGYVWNESDFNRDPGTGRFRTKVSHTQSKPIHERTATSLGIPKPPKHIRNDPKLVAQYQDEYRQLASFLGAVTESAKTPGDTKVALHFVDNAGQRSVKAFDGTHVKPTELDPENLTLIGIEAKPNTLTVGGAAFGLSQSLGRGGVSTINAAEKGSHEFADSWLAESDPRNSGDRTYRRIEAGSRFLGQVAPYSEKAQMASAFGSFVGSMGPEAERVMGPTMRRTAYRYRGTEKTPDPALARAYEAAINHAKNETANDPYRNTREGSRANLKAPAALAPHQMAAQRIMAERRDPTWEERELGRRTVLAYFKGDKEKGKKGKLPSSQLYELQLASGNTPPSEGILIDKNGKIVTQAVGYGDDHYLPFNLRNLKALKGGEYIRTRSVGGITSEDVYTGLMAGARQVTVVSRSGTFTLTFEEDFKGGRRYNDKAKRMTRRYQQILDAVQSEKVDRGSVSPQIMEIITEQVHSEMDGGASPREIRQTIRERVEEYKSDPELAPEGEELINRMSRAALRDGVTRDEKEFKRQVTGKLLAQKQTRYRLDGHGYEAALKALEEQFPYYLTVRSFPEDAQDIQNLEVDGGYVEPGHNRPTAAAAGLFGAQRRGKFAGQGGKFSAAEADYQEPSRGRGPSLTPVAAEAPAAGAATTTGTKSIRPDQMASYIPAVAETQAWLQSFGEESFKDPAMRALLTSSPDEIASDPVKQKKFDDMVNETEKQLRASNRTEEISTAVTSYRSVTGNFSRAEWSPARAGFASNMPFAFPGDAYEKKNPEAKRAELRRIESNMPTSIASTRRLAEMSDNEYVAEISRLTQVRSHFQAANIEGNTSEARVARAQALKSLIHPDSPSAKKLLSAKNPEKVIDSYIEQVHRARAVVHGLDDAQRKSLLTVHAEPRTEEQKAGPRRGIAFVEETFRQAAHKLEESDDPKDEERAAHFHALADSLADGQSDRSILSTADAQSIANKYEPELREAYNLLKDKEQRGGPILR